MELGWERVKEEKDWDWRVRRNNKSRRRTTRENGEEDKVKDKVIYKRKIILVVKLISSFRASVVSTAYLFKIFNCFVWTVGAVTELSLLAIIAFQIHSLFLTRIDFCFIPITQQEEVSAKLF